MYEFDLHYTTTKKSIGSSNIDWNRSICYQLVMCWVPKIRGFSYPKSFHEIISWTNYGKNVEKTCSTDVQQIIPGNFQDRNFGHPDTSLLCMYQCKSIHPWRTETYWFGRKIWFQVRVVSKQLRGIVSEVLVIRTFPSAVRFIRKLRWCGKISSHFRSIGHLVYVVHFKNHIIGQCWKCKQTADYICEM